ncbi:hypothetical protein [Rhizobium straminoryzae]|uniref:Yip1 domain-containing protein n=1 Tax=Rhizobium straminoryzae TaxID=1387186 RepID=A0A549TGZ7_9HYPH|nr:hypothetical protein [Rhizobium straminoryzae]TRL42141.1 hypothetical protein FNA46_02590 [Rhizobium straminoryzae]
MRPAEEIRHHLGGLVLLARGDARGLSHFDISDEGVIRSFRAILYCLPALLLSAILWRIGFLQVVPDGGRGHLVFVYQVLAVNLACWGMALLSVALASLLLGLRPLARPLIVMVNWGGVAVVHGGYLLLLPLLLLIGGGTVWLWLARLAVLALAVTLLLSMLWPIAHTVIGGPRWRRSLIVSVVVLLPLWIAQTLETSMGLHIPYG